MLLRLMFDSSLRGHGDVTLTLGDAVWKCDSYYFALDPGVRPNREDTVKVRVVLRTLLENWRVAILGLTDGHRNLSAV